MDIHGWYQIKLIVMEDNLFDNQSDKMDREEIKWENDIQKLMMQASHGAIFSKDNDLSPEVERESFAPFRYCRSSYLIFQSYIQNCRPSKPAVESV